MKDEYSQYIEALITKSSVEETLETTTLNANNGEVGRHGQLC